MIQNEQTQGQFQQETISEGDETRERENQMKEEKSCPFCKCK